MQKCHFVMATKIFVLRMNVKTPQYYKYTPVNTNSQKGLKVVAEADCNKKYFP